MIFDKNSFRFFHGLVILIISNALTKAKVESKLTVFNINFPKASSIKVNK